MKQLTIAVLIMMMSTSALAVLDPTPDTIGIYLDTGAEEMCVQGLVEGMTDFTLHMIVTNPSFDTMQGFLAGYHFEGIAGVNSAIFTQAGADDSGSLGDHLVNFDSPVPTSAIMQLMSISVTYFSFEYDATLLMLHGIALADKTGNVPGVMDGAGAWVDMHLTSDEGITVRINAGCDVVANESLSFDGIKSMYR